MGCVNFMGCLEDFMEKGFRGRVGLGYIGCVGWGRFFIAGFVCFLFYRISVVGFMFVRSLGF